MKLEYTKKEYVETAKFVEIDDTDNCFLMGNSPLMSTRHYLGVFKKDGRTYKIKISENNIDIESTTCGSYYVYIKEFCEDKKYVVSVNEQEFFDKVNRIKQIINKFNNN